MSNFFFFLKETDNTEETCNDTEIFTTPAKTNYLFATMCSTSCLLILPQRRRDAANNFETKGQLFFKITLLHEGHCNQYDQLDSYQTAFLSQLHINIFCLYFNLLPNPFCLFVCLFFKQSFITCHITHLHAACMSARPLIHNTLTCSLEIKKKSCLSKQQQI